MPLTVGVRDQRLWMLPGELLLDQSPCACPCALLKKCRVACSCASLSVNKMFRISMSCWNILTVPWKNADLGLLGCSSHSGRRTFITNAARKIGAVGGSQRDVQMLAGHSSLAVTQRYIDGDSDARRKIVDLL